MIPGSRMCDHSCKCNVKKMLTTDTIIDERSRTDSAKYRFHIPQVGKTRMREIPFPPLSPLPFLPTLPSPSITPPYSSPPPLPSYVPISFPLPLLIPFPPIPFPNLSSLPSPSLPSRPFASPPSPSLPPLPFPPRSGSPQIQLGVGSAVSSPSGVRGRAVLTPLGALGSPG